MMAAAAKMTGKLPRTDDSAEYGKKSLDKSLQGVVEKTVEATSQMVLKTAEKIVNAQKEQFKVLNKRLEALEQVGGVSQSAPRGAADGELKPNIQKSQQNGVFGGIFGNAPSQALLRM